MLVEDWEKALFARNARERTHMQVRTHASAQTRMRASNNTTGTSH
jgi:hypothetical protein